MMWSNHRHFVEAGIERQKELLLEAEKNRLRKRMSREKGAAYHLLQRAGAWLGHALHSIRREAAQPAVEPDIKARLNTTL